ncbi:MAG: flagellar assembly peptidoglycan hydrolase FlgJ [Lysobacter sp.]|nr:flagellar assembly peptidoglycan hydrolase FlgJ [Lysobacter sp.]
MRLPATTPLPLAPSTTPTHARIEEAAHGLEAQFAQMLIKSMRNASMGDPLLGDNTTYRDMYDQQLARELTRGKGIGLAPAIVRQLEKSTTPAQAAPVASAPLPLQHAPAALALPAATTPSGLPLPAGLDAGHLALAPSSLGVSLPAVTPAHVPIAACDPDAPLDCSSPEAFVRSVWPHAQKTAAALGIPAKALVAQAALETNWGKRLAGGGSHNLFGIKAGAQWLGEQVNAATHEFVDGVRVARHAAFRAYHSAADSFADYAKLLSGPRYAAARGTGEDTRRFAQALQRAGYATDPSYAAKIAAIANGPTLHRALAGLGSAIATTVDGSATVASIATPAHTEG